MPSPAIIKLFYLLSKVMHLRRKTDTYFGPAFAPVILMQVQTLVESYRRSWLPRLLLGLAGAGAGRAGCGFGAATGLGAAGAGAGVGF